MRVVLDKCVEVVLIILISRILSLGYWSVCRDLHVLSAKKLLKCAGKGPRSVGEGSDNSGEKSARRVQY